MRSLANLARSQRPQASLDLREGHECRPAVVHCLVYSCIAPALCMWPSVPAILVTTAPSLRNQQPAWYRMRVWQAGILLASVQTVAWLESDGHMSRTCLNKHCECVCTIRVRVSDSDKLATSNTVQSLHTMFPACLACVIVVKTSFVYRNLQPYWLGHRMIPRFRLSQI